jgi:hypothetical protein
MNQKVFSKVAEPRMPKVQLDTATIKEIIC